MKWQLLHRACWEGNQAEVERLLEAGANPNQVAATNWRQTPLGRTLEFRITFPKDVGHVETVGVPLRAGAEPMVINPIRHDALRTGRFLRARAGG